MRHLGISLTFCLRSCTGIPDKTRSCLNDIRCVARHIKFQELDFIQYGVTIALLVNERKNMNSIQTLVKRFSDTFFNMNAIPSNAVVDIRDLGMVARFTGTINPLDGWLFFVTETVNANERSHDAFKVTEDGFTYFEARLIEAIQNFFRARTELVVSRETIYRMEREANKFPDYYSQLAKRCHEYEVSHAPHAVPINQVKRTIN